MPTSASQPWSAFRVDAFALCCLLITLLVFGAVYLQYGSLVYFITLDEDVKAPGNISPWFFYLFWLALYSQVGALLKLTHTLHTRQGKWITAGYWLISLLLGTFISRVSTFMFVVMGLGAYHYLRRPLRVVHFVLVGILLVAYLSVAGLYREWISPSFAANSDELLELAQTRSDLIVRYVVGNFEQFHNVNELIREVPDQLPHQYGSTFLPLLVKPIPRAIWPSKPMGASAIATEHFSPAQFDAGYVTTVSAWGEFFLNFSWVGVFSGMWIMGFMASKSYIWMRVRQSGEAVIIYMIACTGFMHWTRMDFNAGATNALFLILPAYAGLRFVSSSAKRIAHS